jgi:hypothetical protein
MKKTVHPPLSTQKAMENTELVSHDHSENWGKDHVNISIMFTFLIGTYLKREVEYTYTVLLFE